MRFFNHKKNSAGFTLIEIMVSVSIFVIVAFVITSVFLTTADANRKAQEIKVAMDNLSFALDSMTIKIKEGTNYDDTKPSDRFVFRDISGDQKRYLFIPGAGGANGRIEFKECGGCPSKYITSDEVNITDLEFIVRDDGLPFKKRVTILISGNAGKKVNESSIFRVQTTIAQRNSG